MAALDECHARGFLFKAIGGCNEAKREVNKCFESGKTRAYTEESRKIERAEKKNKRALGGD